MMHPHLSIVAAVNDDRILAHNLMRSRLVETEGAEIRYYRGFDSASAAYNRGLDETSGDIVLFAHQDVYLPAGFRDALDRAVTAVTSRDPNWAVLGAFGVTREGQAVGHVWSSGLGQVLGGPLTAPAPAAGLDELLLVLRRASGLRFDPGLKGFHLYGTDIVLTAEAAGLNSYVVDIPVVHNSRPVRRLKADYAAAHNYMRSKWRDRLPRPTLLVPLTPSRLPLAKKRMTMILRAGRRLKRSVDSATDPQVLARRMGVE